jgi:hypothetical protein
LFDVFLHLAYCVVAEAGVDMTIGRCVNKRGHAKRENQEKRWGRGNGEESGIPFGKEMEDSIDIRGIADVTHFHVEIDEPFQVVHLDRKSGSIWQVIDQGVDLA